MISTYFRHESHRHCLRWSVQSELNSVAWDMLSSTVLRLGMVRLLGHFFCFLIKIPFENPQHYLRRKCHDMIMFEWIFLSLHRETVKIVLSIAYLDRDLVTLQTNEFQAGRGQRWWISILRIVRLGTGTANFHDHDLNLRGVNMHWKCRVLRVLHWIDMKSKGQSVTPSCTSLHQRLKSYAKENNGEAILKLLNRVGIFGAKANISTALPCSPECDGLISFALGIGWEASQSFSLWISDQLPNKSFHFTHPFLPCFSSALETSTVHRDQK